MRAHYTGTLLYDAVDLGSHDEMAQQVDRKATILLTDGGRLIEVGNKTDKLKAAFDQISQNRGFRKSRFVPKTATKSRPAADILLYPRKNSVLGNRCANYFRIAG